MSHSQDPAAGPRDIPDEPPDEASAAIDEDVEGMPAIAAGVADALSGLADLPVEQHPEVYDDIHRRLGDTLSGIDHV